MDNQDEDIEKGLILSGCDVMSYITIMCCSWIKGDFFFVEFVFIMKECGLL